MIEKWYCLKCGTCGEVSAKDAIERERNNSARAIAMSDGKCFCCADCYEIWTNTRKYKRREEREMNRVMEKFGGKDE